MVGLQGAIGVIAGLIALVLPGATALGLLFAIAAWSLAIGVLQIVAAIKLRKEITGEFWLGLSGLLSIVFAFFVIARPGAGALAVDLGDWRYAPSSACCSSLSPSREETRRPEPEAKVLRHTR